MKGLLAFLRERAKQLGVGDRGIVFAGAGLVVAAVAGGIWVYTAVTQPPEAGVLPLPAAEFVQGEVLIKFKPGTPAEDRRNINAQNNLTELQSIGAIGVNRLGIPPGFGVNEVVNRLQNNPNVEYIEPNYLGNEQDDPNDPAYASAQWNLKKIGASGAWDISKGSSSVVIAVTDSGVFSTHVDLGTKIKPGYNFVSNNTDTSDGTGHGTIVSGVAGALTGNATGVAGLGRLNPIMPLRVVDSTGSFTYSNLATAIIHAADNGAKVINISLGGTTSSIALQDAINYAWGKGVVLAAAVGNDGTVGIRFPASANNVIAVGATDASDVKANFSNTGPELDVVAPGVGVYSTNRSGSYGPYSGTSYATPHVAALAALLFSANASLTNADVVSIITGTAVDLGSSGKDSQYGYGRINALAALQQATGTSTLQQQAAATATPTATVVAPTATPVATTSAATATPTATVVGQEQSAPTATATATTAPATATATSGPTLKTDNFSGSVDQRRGPATVNHTFSVAAAGTITASLNWSGGADLDMFLLNPAGQQVASVTGKGKPQNLSFNATAIGTYTLRVVAASGSASYTLSATHP